MQGALPVDALEGALSSERQTAMCFAVEADVEEQVPRCLAGRWVHSVRSRWRWAVDGHSFDSRSPV